MELSVSGQALDFLLACLLGAGLGVLYDVFRIVRMAFWRGRLLIAVQDILYWVLAAVCTFLFMLMRSDGQIRFHILLGETLGFVVYYFTVGMIVFHASKFIINLIKKVLRFLYRIFIRPFVKLFAFIFQKVKNVFVYIGVKCKKMRQNSKMHLQQKDSLLYNQDNTKKRGKESVPYGKRQKKTKKKRRKKTDGKD